MSALLDVILLIFRILTLPLVIPYWLSGKSERVFQSTMQVACLVPTTLGIFIRQALLKWMAVRCGRKVAVHLGTLFSSPVLEIGEDVYMGAFCNIGRANIGDHVLFGSNVHILSGKRQHGYERTDIPMSQQAGTKSTVTIGKGAWIGNAAIVLADIGEECIVGAGSVVVDPIPAWSVAVGSPARVVADRRAAAQAREA
jgi:acetyltransferase-like isoleucine patch superfamily enzyme